MSDLSRLREPFPPDDIEWRIQRSGLKNGKPWAMVLAYVTARAIMDRLDDVCGPENWCNEYKEGPSGGVLCGISIRVADAWVTKWDGAENTNIEAIKGGLSGATKRAAVQWGIGRYLYNLEAGFANFTPNGKYKDSIKEKDAKYGEWFNWDPPPLPAWAVPGSGRPTQQDNTIDKLDDELSKIVQDAVLEGLISREQGDETIRTSKKHGGQKLVDYVASVKKRIERKRTDAAANAGWGEGDADNPDVTSDYEPVTPDETPGEELF